MPIRKSKDPQRNRPWCCELNWTDKVTGEKHRETKWFRSEAEAIDYHTDHKKLIKDRLKTAKKDSGTIRVAVELFLKDCERKVGKRQMAESTLNLYRRSARLYVLPDLGPVILTDPLVVVKCQDCLNELPHKSNAAHASKILIGAFKLAKQRRMIPIYPFIGPDKLQFSASNEEMTILEIPEIGRLLEAAAIRHYDERELTVATRSAGLLMMCLMGGMRVGEACGLQWKSVDWINGTVHIWQQYVRGEGLVDRTKTDAGNRTVKMPRQVREALTELFEVQGRPNGGHVLRNRNGEPIYRNFGANYFAPAMRHAGLVVENPECPVHVLRLKGGHNLSCRCKPKCRVHDLRHSYVSMIIEIKLRNGQPVDWKALAKEIGHKNASLTMDLYAHLAKDNTRIADAAAAAADVVLPAPPRLRLVSGGGSESD
jgi:integrase